MKKRKGLFLKENRFTRSTGAPMICILIIIASPVIALGPINGTSGVLGEEKPLPRLRGNSLSNWKISEVAVISEEEEGYYRIAVQDCLAYLLLFDEEFLPSGFLISRVAIVDVWNPEKPVRIGMYEVGKGRVVNIKVKDALAYFVSGSSYDEGVRNWTLTVLDVSDPANPSKLGEYNSENNSVCYDFALYRNYVFLGTSNELEIINISDPANPVQVANYSLPSYSIRVCGHLAFVKSGGIKVLDLTNPEHPVQLGEVAVTKHFSEAMDVIPGYVFMAFQWAGLQAYNVSDPSNPSIVGDYSFPKREFSKAGLAHDMQTEGKKAFVCGRELYVFDVSDPQNIRRVARKSIGKQHGYSISVSGGYIYITTLDSLRIFSFTEKRIFRQALGIGVLIGVAASPAIMILALTIRHQRKITKRKKK